MTKRPLCLAALIFAGILFLVLKLCPDPVHDGFVMDGKKISVTGKVEKKQFKNDKSVIYLSHTSVDGIPYKQNADKTGRLGVAVYLDGADGGFSPPSGAYVRAVGKARLFESPGNPGQFDQVSYYRTEKIDFMLQKAEILECGREYSRLREGLWMFRESVSGLYDRLLDKDDAGVIKAMLLGNKESLDGELKELYQRNGISHILAISGLHVSVIGMGLYRILRKIGLPYGAAGLAGGAVMVCFGVMTGGSASTMRAVIMYLVCVLAAYLGRTYDMLTALSLSAVLLLLEQPYYLCHSGFLLSFGAVAGIGVLYPVLEEIFPCGVPVLGKLFRAFLAGLSITAATLPVTLFYYYQLPVYASFLNLLIIPLMGTVLLFGLLCACAGFLWLPAGKLLAVPCGLILSLYEKSCRLCDSLPGPLWTPGKPSAAGICAYYGLLAAGLMLWQRLKRGREESERCGRDRVSGRERREKRVRGVLIFRLLLPVWLCAMVFLLSLRREAPLSVTVLDVGQGDGICIRAGKRFSCLIDGGSSDVSGVGKYRILPYLRSQGIGKLNYAFVTHTDQDHISGLKELLLLQGRGGVRIETLVLPAIGNPDEAYAELEGLAAAAGVRVLYMKAGDAIGLSGVKITCLFPSAGFSPEDKNDASMVLEAACGDFRGLFMGDLGEKGEERILEAGRCGDHEEGHTFLKAGHHGSDTSSSQRFLESMGFKLAVLSCGRDNRYGHPGKETTARLRDNRIRSFITYREGALRIRTDGKRVRLDGFRRGEIGL